MVVVVLTKKDVGDANEAISVNNISSFLVCRELKFFKELKKNVLDDFRRFFYNFILISSAHDFSHA